MNTLERARRYRCLMTAVARIPCPNMARELRAIAKEYRADYELLAPTYDPLAWRCDGRRYRYPVTRMRRRRQRDIPYMKRRINGPTGYLP